MRFLGEKNLLPPEETKIMWNVECGMLNVEWSPLAM